MRMALAHEPPAERPSAGRLVRHLPAELELPGSRRRHADPPSGRRPHDHRPARIHRGQRDLVGDAPCRGRWQRPPPGLRIRAGPARSSPLARQDAGDRPPAVSARRDHLEPTLDPHAERQRPRPRAHPQSVLHTGSSPRRTVHRVGHHGAAAPRQTQRLQAPRLPGGVAESPAEPMGPDRRDLRPLRSPPPPADPRLRPITRQVARFSTTTPRSPTVRTLPTAVILVNPVGGFERRSGHAVRRRAAPV